MCLEELAEEELELRRVQVVECIMQLRRSAKRLSSARAQKKKDGRGQYEGSRSTTLRHSLEFNQECLLLIYNLGRQALISLSPDKHVAEAFPPLCAADLFRKTTTEKRQLGDSRRADGELWKVGARASLSSESQDPSPSSSQPHSLDPLTQTPHQPSAVSEHPPTSGTRTARGDSSEGGGEQGEKEREREDGRLWSPVLGLSVKEVEEWDLEGKFVRDRVNWALTIFRRGSRSMVSYLG